MDKLTARQLVDLYGKSLIGMEIMTPAMGEYPGGMATVVELGPDENAPEIVFDVNNPGWDVGDGTHQIGVFEHEICEIDF